MNISKERTLAVVNLTALEHNVKNVKSRLKDGVELIAVLKGDGYGHGEKGIYQTFKKSGVDKYAVAIWEEGVALRNAGATEPILLLGDTADSHLDKLIEYNLTPSIFLLDTAQKLNELAKEKNVVQPIDLKFDTGMNRIGFQCNEKSIEDIKEISLMSNLKISGAFTHFAKADEENSPTTTKQLKLYNEMINKLEKIGISIECKHTANSPAIILHPETQLDAVRAGDILYGLCAIDENNWYEEDFRQVMSWYSYVIMVKTVAKGSQVGYGGTFVAKRETKIATVPVGFADGYSRFLSNKGKVIINGQEAPIIGKVCMDQFMVDVTDIENVSRGDTVTLLDENLSVLWMADLLGANVDEIVCSISKRVPRVYINDKTGEEI